MNGGLAMSTPMKMRPIYWPSCCLPVKREGDLWGISSTTSTGAEVWLVLCELCFSHPSVGVFFYNAHSVWSGCKPRWLNHLKGAVDVDPDGWTTDVRDWSDPQQLQVDSIAPESTWEEWWNSVPNNNYRNEWRLIGQLCEIDKVDEWKNLCYKSILKASEESLVD